jgi:1-acyl-sn-glycerol-3-phosphate acyltransferase
MGATAPDDAAFYMLDVGQLPDVFYKPDVPAEKWVDRCETVGSEGFKPGSLNKVSPLPTAVEAERLVGMPLYLSLNYLPFFVLIYACVRYGFLGLVYVALGWIGLYVLTAAALLLVGAEPRSGQYVWTERRNQKYCSLRYVWPKSLQKLPAGQPVIFAAIPHGVAPMGITCYPLWSKLWSGTLCHWVAAPIVLKLPLIGPILKSVLGFIPAKSPTILQTLAQGESVGVVLDGIAGMFQPDTREERAWVLNRKAIVAIALKAGVPLVPVYSFGHSELWTIITDSFGIMERLSILIDLSIVPFVGRMLLPFGPPRRRAVLVAVGEPIQCPRIEKPSRELVDEYHGKLLERYAELFEQHKVAYGWESKKLRFV